MTLGLARKMGDEQKVDEFMLLAGSLTGKELQKAVTRKILSCIWSVLPLTSSQRKWIYFKDLFVRVTELLMAESEYFQKNRVSVYRVKRAMANKNTNLAFFSNNAELCVARASDIHLFENMILLFTPMPGNSQAVKRRRVARDLLVNEKIVSASTIHQILKKDYGIDFLVDSFWIREGGFIIKSTKDGLSISCYDRMKW